MKSIKTLMLLLALSVSFLSHAERPNYETVGVVKLIRQPSYENVTVYFKMDSEQEPEGVTQWLYLRSDGGQSAGCSSNGNIETLNRSYAMLMESATKGIPVKIGYCADEIVYGLVGFVDFPYYPEEYSEAPPAEPTPE